MKQHRSLVVSKRSHSNRWAALIVPAVFFAAGCGTAGSGEPIGDDAPVGTVPAIGESIVQKGLTCETMQAFIDLPPEDAARVAQFVREQLSEDEISDMIERRESCSVASSAEGDESTAEAEQALYSGTWKWEAIEGTDAGGGFIGSVSQDSAAYGWMCNSGNSEWPADYVLNVSQVPNAYTKASSLRVHANGLPAECGLWAFENKLDGRVYSDNSMRVCVGYWRMSLCGGGFLLPSDFSFLTVP